MQGHSAQNQIPVQRVCRCDAPVQGPYLRNAHHCQTRCDNGKQILGLPQHHTRQAQPDALCIYHKPKQQQASGKVCKDVQQADSGYPF